MPFQRRFAALLPATLPEAGAGAVLLPTASHRIN